MFWHGLLELSNDIVATLMNIIQLLKLSPHFIFLLPQCLDKQFVPVFGPLLFLTFFILAVNWHLLNMKLGFLFLPEPNVFFVLSIFFGFVLVQVILNSLVFRFPTGDKVNDGVPLLELQVKEKISETEIG